MILSYFGEMKARNRAEDDEIFRVKLALVSNPELTPSREGFWRLFPDYRPVDTSVDAHDEDDEAMPVSGDWVFPDAVSAPEQDMMDMLEKMNGQEIGLGGLIGDAVAPYVDDDTGWI